MNWQIFVYTWIWFGFAALGFAILFNVPKRSLPPIFMIAVLGGVTKLLMMQYGFSIIFATLAGATLIGFASIPLAHRIHVPPPIFAIPAVIPMVPGILAYRMMLGLVSLAGTIDPSAFNKVLSETINSGLKVMLILMCLAGGVGIPMLITRKESAKNIRLMRSRNSSDEEGDIA
jgi:uncharacterized membrane protein YjjB (DUF3815 family)